MTFTRIFQAVAVLLGMIIGAGIFGLPYVFARSGFAMGLIHLIVLGAVLTIMMLAYAEIVLRTKSTHQFPGYIGIYLGKNGKRIATFSLMFSLMGSLIAYLIQTGKFIQNVFEPFFSIHVNYFIVGFFVITWIAILKGIEIRTRVQIIMVFALIAMIIALFVGTIGDVHVESLFAINARDAFLPYGAVLFALTGFAAVVEVVHILKEQRQYINYAIIIAQVLAVIITAIFTFVIVGLFNSGASADPIADLGAKYGPVVLIFGGLFGTMVIATSYITLSTMVMQSFQFDFGWKFWHAAAIASLIPFVVALSGLTSFITTILIVGAVGGGIDGILLIAASLKAEHNGDNKPAYNLHLPIPLAYVLAVMFAAGMIYELYYTIFQWIL
jgi:amino acid permease